jgi:hypothetical protein
MSDALHHVATASLPVATGLLVLTAVDRAVMWAEVKDERLAHLAREYLGALSTWCLILVAVHAAALGGAGGLDAGSVGVALVIGAAAVLLRSEADTAEEEPEDTPEWAVAAREPAAPASRPLWDEPADERRTGLWT